MVVLPRMLSGSLQSGGLPTGHLGAFFTFFVEFQEAQMIVENLNAPLADFAGENLWPAGTTAPVCSICSAPLGADVASQLEACSAQCWALPNQRISPEFLIPGKCGV